MNEGSARGVERRSRVNLGDTARQRARAGEGRTEAVTDEVEKLVGDHLLGLCIGEHDGDVLRRKTKEAA